MEAKDLRPSLICPLTIESVTRKNFDYSDCTDQTCQSNANDSTRDWRWFGLDGLALGKIDPGLADWMPKLGEISVDTEGQPLPIAFSSAGWIA